MRKINIQNSIIFLSILFVIFTLLLYFVPEITKFDNNIIMYVQQTFSFIPLQMAELCDAKLYSAMIVLPLIVGMIYFFRKYLVIDMVIFPTIPLFAYLINIVIKNIVQRPRPPIELQLSIHPASFSYVSSHTLVTFCLCGLSIYYLNLYCKNLYLKYGLSTVLCLWILTEPFSRIFLGVHHPTDILGAFCAGSVILLLYIKLAKTIGGKI